MNTSVYVESREDHAMFNNKKKDAVGIGMGRTSVGLLEKIPHKY
jgi:hypothetical protein